MNHPLQLDKLLLAFLAEDLGQGDITTDPIFPQETTAGAVLVARQELVSAGVATACRVFSLLDAEVLFSRVVADGDKVAPGAVLLELRGPVRSLLHGERVALNLLQRLCGIATLTRAFVEQVEGLPVRIVDTRKTTPGLRLLEKAAVRAGGGYNHRFNLADGVLIKDNHIAACGSIAGAVQRVRTRAHHLLKIEVECDRLDQVQECLECGVEVILLDNMNPAQLREAVALAAGRAVLEASGGVHLANVREIAATGVDLISVGALTHSAPACDIGMDLL